MRLLFCKVHKGYLEYLSESEDVHTGPIRRLRGPMWYSLDHNMSDETINKWLVALRSGDYDQIPEMLFGTHTKFSTELDDWGDPMDEWEVEGFCCLGVLGNICGAPVSRLQDGGFLDKELLDMTGMLEGEIYTDPANNIPPGNKECPETLQSLLARMNDEEWTFNQIADWIEENLLETDELRI